ncbi:MAG: peptide-methionine (S)-S-oxide reductase [Hyphomonadaceae bacterium]
MTVNLVKIGLGGGCHWCTEAVFQSLLGVQEVHSGWIASDGPNSAESEAVIVHFDPGQIALETLIEIHLLTHASASNHSMRVKYRSAIYVFSDDQSAHANQILATLSKRDDVQPITQILRYSAFRAISDAYENYYYAAPDRPFCVNMIEPKLKKLIATHREFIDQERLKLSK